MHGWSGVGLKVRKAAVGVFESYVGGGTAGRDAAEGIVGTMKAPPEGNPNDTEDGELTRLSSRSR